MTKLRAPVLLPSVVIILFLEHIAGTLYSLLTINPLTPVPPKTPNLVPRVLSLPPSRKYPGFGWSRVSLKQTAPHQGGLAFLQEAKGKANANLFKLARRRRNGSHQLTFFSKTGTLKESTGYYLQRFRSTNNADFLSTKYFTVGSICFKFAEGV